MPDPTPTTQPRLGVALVIGSDAARVVHVHTGPDGIRRIQDRLDELDMTVTGRGAVEVNALFGVARGLAEPRHYVVPAGEVDALATLALAQHRTVHQGETR